MRCPTVQAGTSGSSGGNPASNSDCAPSEPSSPLPSPPPSPSHFLDFSESENFKGNANSLGNGGSNGGGSSNGALARGAATGSHRGTLPPGPHAHAAKREREQPGAPSLPPPFPLSPTGSQLARQQSELAALTADSRGDSGSQALVDWLLSALASPGEGEPGLMAGLSGSSGGLGSPGLSPGLGAGLGARPVLIGRQNSAHLFEEMQNSELPANPSTSQPPPSAHGQGPASPATADRPLSSPTGDGGESSAQLLSSLTLDGRQR
mmetsp:Transcript_25142/g.58147  ORF Transcript_25142/g.58147 Transcript_25142/m.58147 type:complete len:264 (+) Transcript_25142:859-1650(+)